MPSGYREDFALRKSYISHVNGMGRVELINISQAALFSAIVAAFTIESSKLLRVDHHESTAKILFVIHQQLDSIARQNITSLPPLIPDPAATFELSPDAVYVNTVWFVSFTLSLGTAAAVIMCLQWLREHEKEPNGAAADVLPLRVLRIQMIDNWGVPTIIGILPILLLLSIFLFGAGFHVSFQALFPLSSFPRFASTGLAFCAIFICLPLVFPQCAFRTPQGWLLRITVFRPLALLASVVAHFASGTGVERGWRSLGQRLSKIRRPVSLAAKRLQGLEDWSSWDKRTLRRTRDFGFQWFATAFAHDQQAIHAFVQCADVKMGESKAEWTAKEMEKDVHIRVGEMVSLYAGEPLAVKDPIHLAQWPSGMAYDVAMAYCIDYATAMHSSLIPTLLARRSEVQLRILNTALSSGYPLHTDGVVLSTVRNFNSGYCEYLLHDESLISQGRWSFLVRFL